MRKATLALIAMAVTLATAGIGMADSFYTAPVKRAAVKEGTVKLMLTQQSGMNCAPGATNAWYKTPSGQEDQALAVALTAIAGGYQLRIGVSDSDNCQLTQVGLENK